MSLHFSPRTTIFSNRYLGLDHLLASGRGAGGQGEEAIELHIACFMGLVSFLAGRPEVLRVAPNHQIRLLNAAARANIQTATVTSTPFTDAGLDGTGEVIQVNNVLNPCCQKCCTLRRDVISVRVECLVC